MEGREMEAEIKKQGRTGRRKNDRTKTKRSKERKYKGKLSWIRSFTNTQDEKE